MMGTDLLGHAFGPVRAALLALVDERGLPAARGPRFYATAITVALAEATIGSTLHAAGEYITAHGWHRGYLYDDHRTCSRGCAVHRTGLYQASIIGAIRAALVGAPKWDLDTLPPQVRAEVAEAYGATTGHLNTHLIHRGARGLSAPALMWQAAAGRTALDVIAALRDAAATAPPQQLCDLGRAEVVDLATYRSTRRPAA
ncbi:DUF6197 family protein [Actinoplanes philippinensis]|uniref:DUF6197 family protein n=1 Tax=Actinoplanes philippinensis TaxID=35752 RepID=UPI0033F91693